MSYTKSCQKTRGGGTSIEMMYIYMRPKWGTFFTLLVSQWVLILTASITFDFPDFTMGLKFTCQFHLDPKILELRENL